MAHRYIVVSDLHLCDIEEHADGWKAYKSSRFCFDGAFVDLLDRFVADGDADDERTLILNGDIVDFDLVCTVPEDPPFPVSRAERRRGMRPTEEKSVWKLQRVLADHPRFLGALARFAAGGYRIIYVIGNHDRELHFPAVQHAFVTAVVERGAEEELCVDAACIRFEPWFYYVPGEIYAEHGQQYDYYNSFRFILSPVVNTNKPPTLALPMGNLSNRRLMSQMGFFNPYASDYILNVFRYFSHWLKHYAFSRRRLFFNWLFGSLSVILQLLRTKRKVMRHPPDSERLLADLSGRTGIELDTLRALDQLKRKPITNRWYRVIREFWIDRMLVAALMTGGTITLAFLPVPLWLKLMVPLSSFPALYWIYEWFAHGETVFSAYDEAHKFAREISKLVDARVITFGHTHVPGIVPLAPGVSYVNTGTWAPVWRQDDRRRLEPGLRNALIVVFAGGRTQIELTTGLPQSSHRDTHPPAIS